MIEKPNPLDIAVRSLHFQEDRRDLLRAIPESAWPRLLELTDRSQLTLPLALRCAAFLPGSVQSRVQRNLTNNRERYRRISEAWREIAGTLTSREIEFLVLKGLTHSSFDRRQPWHRPQYDIDLYCPSPSIARAADALADLGYKPIGARGRSSSDHLPAMVRAETGEFCGDYYAIDLPMPVELHFQFWRPAWERFDVNGAESFWSRREVRDAGGLRIPALQPVDGLTYACWHVIRHLLRGALKIYHVYELAHFLQETSDDRAFWSTWSKAGSPDARVPETVALRLAAGWFGCKVNPVVQEYFDSLSPAIVRWFALYGSSPAGAPGQSRKDELFLHLCLLDNRRDRCRVALRRAFPQLPAAPMKAHAAVAAGTAKRIWLVAQRAWYHVRALSHLGRDAFRWWRASNGCRLFE